MGVVAHILLMSSSACEPEHQNPMTSGSGMSTRSHGEKSVVEMTRRRPNEGRLQLVLRRRGQRTVLQDCYFQVPLQILRPLYLDETGAAYVYVISPCGGVVGGDTYTLGFVLEAGAHACVTTPSATKLYATTGAVARQHITCTLQAGAILEYLPEQTIPFADAAFQQEIDIRLGPGACLVLADILAPGRLARGEAFAYREYTSSLRVYNAQGQVCLWERMGLQPRQQRLDGLGLWEGYPYLGSFYTVVEGQQLPEALAEGLHGLLADRPQLLGSATMLACGGVAVRLLGADHTTISAAMYTVWDVVRRQVLGYPAVVWRK
jgi:urease accessory protein